LPGDVKAEIDEAQYNDWIGRVRAANRTLARGQQLSPEDVADLEEIFRIQGTLSPDSDAQISRIFSSIGKEELGGPDTVVGDEPEVPVAHVQDGVPISFDTLDEPLQDDLRIYGIDSTEKLRELIKLMQNPNPTAEEQEVLENSGITENPHLMKALRDMNESWVAQDAADTSSEDEDSADDGKEGGKKKNMHPREVKRELDAAKKNVQAKHDDYDAAVEAGVGIQEAKEKWMKAIEAANTTGDAYRAAKLLRQDKIWSPILTTVFITFYIYVALQLAMANAVGGISGKPQGR
jgi:hypothetical protein